MGALPLDVRMLDPCYLGPVVMPGAAVHPAGKQVVDDPDDGQHEQKEDEGAADVKANTEKPEDDENRHDCPDQTRQLMHLLAT